MKKMKERKNNKKGNDKIKICEQNKKVTFT